MEEKNQRGIREMNPFLSPDSRRPNLGLFGTDEVPHLREKGVICSFMLYLSTRSERITNTGAIYLVPKFTLLILLYSGNKRKIKRSLCFTYS